MLHVGACLEGYATFPGARGCPRVRPPGSVGHEGFTLALLPCGAACSAASARIGGYTGDPSSNTENRMTDVQAWIRTASTRLGDRLEAEMLLLHVLGQSRAWLFAHGEHPLDEPCVRQLDGLLQRRAQGEPMAYILGYRDFWSLQLEVSPATLIPRPDTELLVEWALAQLPVGERRRVADLGTGSGAIALAIAHQRVHAEVVAVDASAAALQVARRNAERLHLLDRVQWLQGDWLQPLAAQYFDLIVSNPPYIEAGDAHLRQGDLRFEPSTALVSGADGLDAIREIVATAQAHLHPTGWLALEHGWKQGPAVRALLRQRGYQQVFTLTDLEGRDRISGGCRPPP